MGSTRRGAGRAGWGVALLVTAATVTACAGPAGRDPVAVPVTGPPVLMPWVEIEGRWEVTADDGGTGALLQPALVTGTDGDDDAPREPDRARWVDSRTGVVVWERDDVGDALDVAAGLVVVATGAGADRAVAGLDVWTGETVWSVPESEIGECAGWSAVGSWSSGDGVDGPAPLVLRGPEAACRTDRAVLVELDPVTGEHTELVRATGAATTGTADGHLVLATWSPAGVSLWFFDAAGEQVATATLDAAELLAGTDLTAVGADIRLRVHQVAAGLPWLRTYVPGDDAQRLVTEHVLDPAAGTVERRRNDDCLPADRGGVYRWEGALYRFGTTELGWCVVTGEGASTSTVQVFTPGAAAVSWSAPNLGAGTQWRPTACRGEVDDPIDGRPMLLAGAPASVVRAYDLSTGEVLWDLADPDAARVVSGTWSDADRAIVLSEDEHGAQRVRTVRLCTGEVLADREVSGADVAIGGIDSSGSLLTVPVGATTLLGRFEERGPAPGPGARGGGAGTG